ncbi:MAG: M1 family aminopeptidase [Burkholderiales bacterium]|nr:M1 family aminopeptidase [Burkholderiales bacterium]
MPSPVSRRQTSVPCPLSAVLRTAWALAAALALAGAAPAAGPVAPVAHDIAVRIDPATRALSAEDRIALAPGPARVVTLDDRYRDAALVVDGKPAPAPARERGLLVWRLPASERARVIEARWSGTLDPLDVKLDHRQALTAAAPVAGDAGTFLPAAARWYPNVEGELASFRVALDLPHGQKGVAPGRLVEERETAEGYRARFEFAAPVDGIDLMAGPYAVAERVVKGVGGKPIRLRTYFHAEVATLAAGYLDAVARYLSLYEGWIGDYPFSEFSVVTSPTPTGFGMPTLTYLGIDVVRLPFIRDTSLGHEVLHSWWGNGVYPDYAGGNWSEGLTTFMADYAYREREGAEAAREMRLAWLRDLAAVPPGQDRPLGEFRSRTHGTSQIVGYNKAAMMFHALRDAIGAQAFDEGLRRFWHGHRFRVASWRDLERSFSEAAGRDLAPFFAQWLGRSGLPAVRLAEASAAPAGSGFRVAVTLEQASPPWSVRVPLAIRTEKDEETRVVELDRARATFAFETAGRPVSVALDPGLAVPRRLGADEAPPILRQAMVDATTATVLLATSGPSLDAARALAAKLQDHALRPVAANAPLPASPVLAIGVETDVDAWLARHRLPPRPAALSGRGTAQVWTAARAGAGPVAVVSARDAEALAALLRPLPHYGRQSFLVFDGAKAIERGVWPSRPQTVVFR